MFKSILGRKKDDKNEENAIDTALVEKISKMNLTEMRSYIKNNIQDFDVSEDGLNEVLRRLITEDEKSKKYYLKADDMDSKKKKAFDLIIVIVQNKKINLVTVELIQKFVALYSDIIEQYDREHKEIYGSRFVDAVNLALANINKKVALQKKMNILGENNSSV
jgi:Ni,Fe-hydrogenase III component G